MDAEQYLDQYGPHRAAEVAKKAGVSMAHFYAIANGRRRPSVDTAEKLVAASGRELNFMALIKSRAYERRRAQGAPA